MHFRMVRSDAMFSAEPMGIEALAEHIIKYMAHQPGLSRAGILTQFQREYGVDIVAVMEEFEAKAVENGYEPGTTCLEAMSRGMDDLEVVGC